MKKSSYSLLYAEDEKDVRQNYALYMQMYFENVYEAKNGEIAYELYEKQKPDVVILDVEMPLLNGLEVARAIRQKDKTTKIILLTAHSDKETLLDAVKLNLIDYLVKPITRNTLKTVLEDAINMLDEENVNDEFLVLGSGMKVDLNKLFLYKNDEEVYLTRYEKRLLQFFINRRNTVLSKIDIFNEIWDDFDREYNDVNVRNLVKNLRKKLPSDIVENVYGSGYIFKLP